MRALVITEPGKVEVCEIEKPAPAAGEVLLKVRMVGYCGSDLNTYRGKNPLVSYPRIVGHELAATIEETGPEVPDTFRRGMNVTVSPYTNCGQCPACRRRRPNACQFNRSMGVQRDGAMTEYITAPWQKLYASDKLSLEEFTLVEPLTVGFHAVDRGRVTPEDLVAVFGCGAIGLGAIAGAAYRGATVVAVDVVEDKLPTALRAGARHTVNSHKESLHERLKEIAAGGPDVIIEAVGLPETFRTAVEEVAFAGRIVYIGYSKAPVAYDATMFVQKELDILGSRNALGDFPSVIAMLEEGKFPVDDVITTVVPPDRAADVLHQWDVNQREFTRIVVDFDAWR